MGILSFFGSCKKQDNPQMPLTHAPIVIDLGEFQIGATLLGAPISASDPFYFTLTKAEVFQPHGQGVEIGSKGGLLDYGFFSLDSFRGSFTRGGQPLNITEDTAESDLLKMFGEPYWIDHSDGEVIMFYEYLAGKVELQFEFPDAKTLGIVTLLRDGVLSDPAQRKRYGVNKPWPPQ